MMKTIGFGLSMSFLRPISANDIANESSTDGTLTATDSLPLFHGAIVAHTHVSTLIEN